MDRGYIKLWRAIEEWDWYHDNETYAAFTKMLMMANWQDKQWQGTLIRRGSFVSSREKLAAKLGLTQRGFRTILNSLKTTSEVTTKSTNKFTIYTIVNYNKYQSDEEKATSKMTSKRSNERPATDQQPTTTKEVKEVKALKEEKKTTMSSQAPTSPETASKYPLKDAVQVFASAYASATGSKYTPQWARDCKLMRTLFSAGEGLEGIAALAGRFFAPEHSFKGNCDIPSFVKAINRLKVGAQPDFSRQRTALAGLNLKGDA